MQLIKPSSIKWQDTGHGYSRKILMQAENHPGKSCKVQFVNIKPNTSVRPHLHKDQRESEYILSGFGSVRSGKQVIKLKPGVMFIVDPDEVHEVKAGKDGLLIFVTKANYSDDTEWVESFSP
jgi:quercetin dioxygenase-like cupin family protein